VTTNWNPDLGSLGAFALGRVGVRRPEITVGHLADVAMAANLVFSGWSVDQPQLWQVQLASVSIVQGTASYVLPANLLLVLDCYLTVTYAGTSTDRIIYPVSRSEFASYPNKAHQAPPTVFWADRTEPVVVSLYPTPDGNASYVLHYYGVYRDQDAATSGASATSLPYRMLGPFADALAAQLALSYAPDRYAQLSSVAGASYGRAQGSESESVPLYISLGLGRYTRM
jgi:hypothetical protein